MSKQLLENSLQATSTHANEVRALFARLVKDQRVKRSLITSLTDWKIADFTCESVEFTAAYSEYQSAVRILSVKFEGAPSINLFNSTIDAVEGFFVAWAVEAI